MALNEGYIATTIGAVAAAVMVTLIIVGLAMILAPSQNEQCDDIECHADQRYFPLVAQAIHVAVSIGSGAGTWLALRLRNQHRAWRTAALVGALYLASGYLLVLFAIVLLLSFLFIPVGTTAATIVIGLILSAASIAALIGCPIAARYIAVR